MQRRRGLARSREREPDGFGEAIAAGSLTLALMTATAFVGFAWERSRAEVARVQAVDILSRVAADGVDAALPAWTGLGGGPAARTARATFSSLKAAGPFSAGTAGECRLESRPLLCTGSRYRCTVAGSTPAGLIDALIGLCHGHAGGWSFDTFDLALPDAGSGNRAEVDPQRDGLIRFGGHPLVPEAPPTRSRRRGLAMPFLQSAMQR